MKSMTTMAATQQDIINLRNDMLAEFRALRHEVVASTEDILEQVHDFMGLTDDHFNKLEAKVDKQGHEIASIKQLLS